MYVQSVAHSPTPSSNRGVPCADVPQNVTGYLLDVHFWSICLNRLFDFFEMGVLLRQFIPFRIFARELIFGSVSLLFSRIPCSSQHAILHSLWLSSVCSRGLASSCLISCEISPYPLSIGSSVVWTPGATFLDIMSLMLFTVFTHCTTAIPASITSRFQW